MKKVFFLSQREAERMTPVPGAAIVSITDPDRLDAKLGPWSSLYRIQFYDRTYSEDIFEASEQNSKHPASSIQGFLGVAWDLTLTGLGLRK